MNKANLFHQKKEFAGVDLRVDAQLALLAELARFYPALNFPKTSNPANRYYYDNAFFSYSDAVIYSLLIRKYKPQRIIEVGSGFSSACALDTVESMGHKTKFSFIEPNPGRLNSILTPDDMKNQDIELVSKVVQEVSTKYFKSLGEGDILFIDSSHVSKTGSDLNYLLHEVLPCLQSGVLVHFHDVFHNFEYPKAWIEEGVSLNEQYVLRPFLQYNEAFQILLFNNYMEVHHREWYSEQMPLCLELHERYSIGPRKGELNAEITGQGLWLKKV